MSQQPEPVAKDIIVHTPKKVAEKIYNDLRRKNFRNILDIGADSGELSNPWKRKKDTNIIAVDVFDDHIGNYKKGNFIHKDFMKTTRKDFPVVPDLILTNPPFQQNKETKNLIPHDWLTHCFKLWGKTIPVVMISGSWLLGNSRKRMDEFNDLNLTKTIKLHKNIFEGFAVEATVMYFNIRVSKSHEFLHDGPYKKPIQKFKSVSFNQDQMRWVEKNISSFSAEIKELLAKNYKDFPPNKRV